MDQNQALYKAAMDSIGFAAQILTPQADQYSALIEAERSMHSYLHITDPSFYRAAINNKGLELQVRMAKAALAFISEIQQIKGEVSAEPPTI